MNPTYTDIFKQIGSQLNLRKKSLMLRTLMIMWPLLLGIAAGYLFVKLFGEERAQELIFTMPYLAYAAGYILLAGIYMWVVGFVFEIEKRIWVDSFFDKKEIEPAKSWSASKKLFVPAVVFRLKIFVRYMLLPLVIFLGTIGYGVYYFGQLITSGTEVNASNGAVVGINIGIVIVLFIGYLIYMYYLRIKLRFSWFIFLDTYVGGDLDVDALVTRMNTLNTAAKGEGFRKALVVAVGTDSVKAIVQSATGIMTQGIGTLASAIPGVGMAGRMVGDMADAYTKQLAEQAASYADIAGQYILYMYANKEAFGKEQEVNEYIYRLSE